MTQNSSNGPADYDALAKKYLDLWQDQIAKLAKDPEQLSGAAEAWSRAAASMMQEAAAGLRRGAGGEDDGAGKPAAASGAQTAGAAPGDGGVDIADILRRLDALEQRIAVLEEQRKPALRSQRSKSAKPGPRAGGRSGGKKT